MRAAAVVPAPVFTALRLLLLSLTLFSAAPGCAYPVAAADVDPSGVAPTPTSTADPGASTTMPPDESDYMGKQGQTGGWSRSGNLTAGKGIGTGATVTLQADFPVADNYIVEFTVSQPAPLPGQSPPNNLVAVFPEALVQWTVEGNTVTRRVSIGNGTTVEGSAAAVRVTAYDNTLIPGTPAVPYGVTINVTKGVRAPSAAGPVLQLVDNRPASVTFGTPLILLIGPGDSVHLPIPQDAGATSIFVTALQAASAGPPAPADGAVLLTFDGAGSYSAGSLIYMNYDLSDVDTWVPIPPGTNTIAIVLNPARNKEIGVTVVLGIDG